MGGVCKWEGGGCEWGECVSGKEDGVSGRECVSGKEEVANGEGECIRKWQRRCEEEA